MKFLCWSNYIYLPFFFQTSYTSVDSYYIEFFFYFVKFDNLTRQFGMEGVVEFRFGLITTVKGRMHSC
jgi:hypothetical protein